MEANPCTIDVSRYKIYNALEKKTKESEKKDKRERKKQYAIYVLHYMSIRVTVNVTMAIGVFYFLQILTVYTYIQRTHIKSQVKLQISTIVQRYKMTLIMLEEHWNCIQ